MPVMEQISREEEFRQAVNDAWERHSLGTYGHAALRFIEFDEDGKPKGRKIERTSLVRMRTTPYIPSRGMVIAWAEGIGESINWWLKKAGYDPIAENLVRETRARYVTQDLLGRLDKIQEKYHIPDEDMAQFREIIERSDEVP